MAKFTKKQRLYLYQFCADMMEAELPLYDSLEKLAREGKALLGAGFAKNLTEFQEKMAKAESVATVFDGFVPQQELSIIYSSERSGSLSEGCRSIVKMVNFRDQLRTRILKAVTFPLIMMALSLIVIAGYAMKVFPLFASVIPVEKWPEVTQSLFSFGKSLVGGLWIIMVGVFIALIIVVKFTMNNFSGVFRNKILDRIIPFTTYKKMNASMFISSLASMLRNNIPLNDALGIIKMNSGRWLRKHIEAMLAGMTQGQAYGDALNTGLLGSSELLNISIYSSLPSFYEVLLSVSEKSDKEVDQKITSLAGLLKSLSTLLLGGSVIWVFVALYALSDQISTMTY